MQIKILKILVYIIFFFFNNNTQKIMVITMNTRVLNIENDLHIGITAAISSFNRIHNYMSLCWPYRYDSER